MPDAKTPKGYLKQDFVDAWERYLPVDATGATTPQNPDIGSEPVADVADVADARRMGAKREMFVL